MILTYMRSARMREEEWMLFNEEGVFLGLGDLWTLKKLYHPRRSVRSGVNTDSFFKLPYQVAAVLTDLGVNEYTYPFDGSSPGSPTAPLSYIEGWEFKWAEAQ